MSGRLAAVRPEPAHRALEQRLRGERGQRRLLRRLPHAGVAAHKGKCCIPSPHRDREIEGRHNPGHAQRMPGFHHAMVRPLRRDGEPAELARQANGEVANVDHFLDLAEALGEDFAGFERHQLAERRLVRAQLQAEQAHQLAALRRRHIAPLQKRGAGRSHGAVHLTGASRMHAADDLPGNRRGHVQRPSGVRSIRNAKACENCPRAGGKILPMLNRHRCFVLSRAEAERAPAPPRQSRYLMECSTEAFKENGAAE